MPKLIKSEHLNEELWKTEKELQNAEGNVVARLAVKVLILIAKVIRDMRHNQVETMKKLGVPMSKSSKKEKVGKDEEC